MPYFFDKKGKERHFTTKALEHCSVTKTRIEPVSTYETNSKKKIFASIVKTRHKPLAPERIATICADEIPYTNLFHKQKLCYPLARFNQYQILFEERIPGIDAINFAEKYLDQKFINSSILKQLLQACLYAFFNLKLIHEANLIHRDLKLDNLILFYLYNPITRRFEISSKIIDFEFARKVSAINVADNVGSHFYASPEVFNEDTNTQTFQSDVFSAGLCLSDLLDGNHRAVQEATEDNITKYQFDFSKTTRLHPHIQEILLKKNKKDEYQTLIRIINIMTQENAEDRGDISTHFETLKNIYIYIYDEDFKPYYIPREKQTKLDKLTKTATRLAGLLHDERFRTAQWQDFFDMYRDQIARYSQPDKLNSVIPDSDDACIEKRELFQIIANFVSEHASEQAIQDNICAIIDILYAIKTAENLIELKEKIPSIENETVKAAIEPWLSQHTQTVPKL